MKGGETLALYIKLEYLMIEEQVERKRGLTGFEIKIIAMILMVFDHIYVYLNYNSNIPIQFKWVGRLVAPLFIFMTVEGYCHTRNKKKYMTRLYIAQLIMAILNNLIGRYFPRPDGIIIFNSMFGTLFLVVIYLSIVDFLKNAVEDKSISKVLLGIGFLAAPMLLSLLLIMSIEKMPFVLMNIIMYLIPMPLMVEGGIVFIFLAILLYLFRDNRDKQIIGYIIASIVIGVLSGARLNIQSLLYENFQWMMVFAAPLMYLYNEEKGKGIKYLFYIFYPAHVYLLYLISYYMLTK